jgi:bacterioferritin
MVGNPNVIAYLNEVLKAELTAINQYFLHAEMLENWGYTKLSKYTRKESIEEMMHAESLIERILYPRAIPRWPNCSACGSARPSRSSLKMTSRSNTRRWPG